MKQILTIVRNLGLALILTASFSKDLRAQQMCNLNIAAQTDPNNSMSYTLNAFLTGDSICSIFNPVYTWTIYSNPGVTLTGSQVSYTFSNPGFYGICVQANYQGMTSTKCDTLIVTQTGINCTPVFASSTQALNASFSLSGSVPSACYSGNSVYNWSFGDSSTATSVGNAGIDHTYSSPGTYNVCLTATAVNGQSYSYCSNVTVSSQSIFSLGGMVLSNSTCLQDSILVELYGIGNNHYASFTMVGGPDSCYYYFQTPLTAQPAQYIIRATPLTNPDFIPTYFGDVLFWGDATMIYPIENVWNLNINLLNNIYDTIPGIGKVSGTITGNGTTVNSVFNGNPISTVFNVNACRVIILNSSNQPIGFGFVNADGTFSVDNLPAGNYFLRIDNPKVPSASIPFSIVSGSTNAVVNFAATGSGINVVTNTANRQKRASMDVWPNPASDQLFVNGLNGTVSILNAQGKEVLKSNAASEINISGLPAGIYQLSGSDANGRMLNARFIKK